jgi:dihydroflavonol-4-reductase
VNSHKKKSCSSQQFLIMNVGPHDMGPTPSGKLVFDALAHKLPPMLPPGGSAVVDARDVAAGMLRVAEIGWSGERYILSGDFVEVADIIANLAALTDAKPPKRHIPYAAAVALATASETWWRTMRFAPQFLQV